MKTTPACDRLCHIINDSDVVPTLPLNTMDFGKTIFNYKAITNNIIRLNVHGKTLGDCHVTTTYVAGLLNIPV